jgi:hypothetical protein
MYELKIIKELNFMGKNLATLNMWTLQRDNVRNTIKAIQSGKEKNKIIYLEKTLKNTATLQIV